MSGPERKTSWGEVSGRIPLGTAGQDAPLTPMQQRVWFVEASSPGRPDFNICTAHRLHGPLNESAFICAFNALVRQQGSLRLRFHLSEAGEVRQSMGDQGPTLDVASAPGLSDAALLEQLNAFRLKPFDLLNGVLCRARLVRVSDLESVFVFVGHHLVCDGWSMMVLSEQMAACYEQALSSMEAASADSSPDSRYLDFARWQTGWLSGPQAQAEVDYWASVLSPMPAPLMLSPQVVKQAAVNSSSRIQVPIANDMLAEVRAVARSAGVSLFAVMFSVYGLTLGRVSGQHDVAIGMPVKGRRDAEMADVIGFFANTLPVRLTWSTSATFTELVALCDKALKDALAHAELPFEQLIRQLPAQRHQQRHPVYQAQFSYVDLRRRSDTWGGLTRSSISVPTFGGAEDLSLLLIERAQDSVLEWCFRGDVLPQDVAARLSRRFVHVLTQVVAPDGVQQRVADLGLMDDEELAEVNRWSAGAVQPISAPSVWSLVHQQSQLSPQAQAIEDGGPVTYAALMAQTDRVAAALHARGVVQGSRVALWLENGPLVAQAILAVWACRASYVPLDPRHPSERLRMILDDAECDLIIVDGDRTAVPTVHLAGHVVTWQELLAVAPADVALPCPAVEAGPDDVAYVMFTSGSTGRPKGVVVKQGAVVNLLTSLRSTLQVTAQDRWLAVTTPSFDISVLEYFLPLACGAAVVWASSEQLLDGHAMAGLIESERATCLQATPAAWRLIMASDWRSTSSRRFLALIGGEALPSDLAHQMLARGLDVWNMYGPTETTVWSSCARMDQRSLERGASIGRPIANTQMLVLDEAGALCPPWVVGQIHIGGAGLAEGYWKREELTARQFITVLAPSGTSLNVFASGDLGYWDADGLLHCLGRVDRQIKWRGFRIEPDEIESCLMKTGFFHSVVVKLIESESGPALVAFLDAQTEQSAEVVRERLQQMLPAYMVPQRLVYLRQGMPRLANGKVDYLALGVGLGGVQAVAQDDGGEQPIDSEVGLALREVWCNLLELAQISPSDNFMDLGGHSMLALRAVNMLEQRFGVRVEIQRYVFQTFRQLVQSYEFMLANAPATKSAAQAPAGAIRRWQKRLFEVFGGDNSKT